MRTGSILFLFGALILTQLPLLPPGYLICFLPVCILISYKVKWLRWLLWLGAGFLWAGVFAQATRRSGRGFGRHGSLDQAPGADATWHGGRDYGDGEGGRRT